MGMCRWKSGKIQGKIFLDDKKADVEEACRFPHRMWSVKAVCGATAIIL